MRQITLILTLKAASNHHASHQRTLYNMDVKSKACGDVNHRRREALNSARNPALLVIGLTMASLFLSTATTRCQKPSQTKQTGSMTYCNKVIIFVCCCFSELFLSNSSFRSEQRNLHAAPGGRALDLIWGILKLDPTPACATFL